jgi:hypothetical protein
MAIRTLESRAEDQVASAIARAVSIANEAAAKEGIEFNSFLIRVDEKGLPPDRHWQIHYIPRDYLQSRGGDLIVLVEESTGEVKQVLLGQ